MAQNADYERRWAERDAKREAQRAEMDAYYERLRVESREAHVAIVEQAFLCKDLIQQGWMSAAVARKAAEVAIDALDADGVVFARMGSWDEAQNDGSGAAS